MARGVNAEKGKRGFQPVRRGKQSPTPKQAVTRRVTKTQLRARRRELLRESPVSEEVLAAKVKYFAPLTDKEWATAAELREIDFLLGD